MHINDAVFLEDLCPKFTFRKWRKSIHNSTGNSCIYCGKPSESIDHVLPKSRGGKDVWENLTTACEKCNVKKGSRTPQEAGMPIFKQPYRPIPITFFRDYNGNVQEPWKPYLYMT